MNKLRISLTEKDGEVKGKIEADGDSLFVGSEQAPTPLIRVDRLPD